MKRHALLSVMFDFQVLPITDNEQITSVLAVDEFREDEYLVLLTQVFMKYIERIQRRGRGRINLFPNILRGGYQTSPCWRRGYTVLSPGI